MEQVYGHVVEASCRQRAGRLGEAPGAKATQRTESASMLRAYWLRTTPISTGPRRFRQRLGLRTAAEGLEANPPHQMVFTFRWGGFRAYRGFS